MDNQQICVIFAGGPEKGLPCMPVPKDAFILCADSGLHLAERLKMKPDLVLGDFDSLGKIPESLPHMTAPVEKDDTDTMLAVRVALRMKFHDIRIFGAFGGRLDHTVANLQTLEFIRREGASGMLIGAGDSASMLLGGERLVLARKAGWSLSVFAWSERCLGVSAHGVAYPLRDAELTRRFPLGVSNRIEADRAEITCGTGTLLVMESKL